MATYEQLQTAFDAFHQASVVLKLRLANAPYSEETEVQRRKVEALREQLLDLVYRDLDFDLKPTEPKPASAESRSH
jgi:hypothetical protein